MACGMRYTTYWRARQAGRCVRAVVKGGEGGVAIRDWFTGPAAGTARASAGLDARPQADGRCLLKHKQRSSNDEAQLFLVPASGDPDRGVGRGRGGAAVILNNMAMGVAVNRKLTQEDKLRLRLREIDIEITELELERLRVCHLIKKEQAND